MSYSWNNNPRWIKSIHPRIPRCAFSGCEGRRFRTWKTYNDHIKRHVEEELER